MKNAKYFEKKGYGFLIEENQIKKELFPLIKSIYEDNDLLNQLRKKQEAHSDKSVFKKIEKEINRLIHDQH